MKYRAGYIVDDDQLQQMSVEEVEDTMIRLSHDHYLSKKNLDELMEIYIEHRKWKLDKMLSYTEEELQRMDEINELLKVQTREVVCLAAQICRDEVEERKRHPDGYDSMTVRPCLRVPSLGDSQCEEQLLPFETEKEEEIWCLLTSPMFNKKLRHFSILSGDCFSEENIHPERIVIDLLYGFTFDGKEVDTSSWGGVMCLDREKTKGICFVWPFHNVYDFCGLAMQDIFRIKKFQSNVEMQYENL